MSDKDWLEQHGVVKEKTYTPPERGGCLTLYLGISFIFAGFGVIMLPALLSKAINNEIPVPNSSVMALGFVMCAYLVSLIGIWNWKYWGLYAFVVMSLVSPCIEALIGIATMSDFIAPFVQLTIMWFLVKDKTQYFT